jgi:predicted ATPase
VPFLLFLEPVKAKRMIADMAQTRFFWDKNVSVFGENSDCPMMQGSDGRIPKGVYLWGTVGGGKTMLMDMFYDTLEGKYF